MVKSTSRNAKISADTQPTRVPDGRIPIAEVHVSVIALVGFMGAGKTTVGRELAERLRWRFTDLDDLIEAAERATIEGIFEERGERGFREIERRILSTTLASNGSPMVLAVGGGAFVDSDNQLALRSAKVPAVFLDAPAEELFSRCRQTEVVRPLLRDGQQFRRLYEQRRPEYLKAAVCVQTSGKAVGAIAEEVIATLKLKRGA